MRRSQEFALEAAKEITIAAMQGSKDQINLENGPAAAQYFEDVYAKIFELADEEKSGT